MGQYEVKEVRFVASATKNVAKNNQNIVYR